MLGEEQQVLSLSGHRLIAAVALGREVETKPLLQGNGRRSSAGDPLFTAFKVSALEQKKVDLSRPRPTTGGHWQAWKEARNGRKPQLWGLGIQILRLRLDRGKRELPLPPSSSLSSNKQQAMIVFPGEGARALPPGETRSVLQLCQDAESWCWNRNTEKNSPW